MWLIGLKCWHGCRHIHCRSYHIHKGYGPHSNPLMQKVLEGLSPFDDWKASCYFRHFQIIFILSGLECLPLDVEVLANLGPPHIHCCPSRIPLFCSSEQGHMRQTESLICNFTPKTNGGVGIIAPASAVGLASGTPPPPPPPPPQSS